jgi:hypothetical protein
MARRLLAGLGGTLAGFGFLAALASLALPWARYRVSADAVAVGSGTGDDVAGSAVVFQLDRGSWYVLCLFALFGLVVGAAVARPRPARWAGLAAVVLGLAGLLLVVDQANRLTDSSISLTTGLARMDMLVTRLSGVWYGLAGAPLLGIGAGLLSVGRGAIPDVRPLRGLPVDRARRGLPN